jgi:hypothetical protein
MLRLPQIVPLGIEEIHECRELKVNEKMQKSTNTWRASLQLRTLIAALLLLGLAAIARPAAAAATCSNASLKGTYGISWGWPQELFAATGNEAMVVGQLTFNGTGSVTGTETISFLNSIHQNDTVRGTYSVAANCTGTISLSPDFFNIYLNSSNTGFQMTLTTAGFEAIGFALPQVSETCALTGETQRLGLNLVGTLPGSSVNKAIIGVLELNGEGTLTGNVSINMNYSNVVKSVSGTYTEASDCTSKVRITPSGLPALHFNGVFVNDGKELLLIETDSGTVIGGTAQ